MFQCSADFWEEVQQTFVRTEDTQYSEKVEQAYTEKTIKSAAFKYNDVESLFRTAK